MAKINITLNDELLDRADAEADKNYMSRSGYISSCISKQLNEVEIINAISRLSNAVDRIACEGSVNDDTLKELEEFQRFSNFVLGQK